MEAPRKQIFKNECNFAVRSNAFRQAKIFTMEGFAVSLLTRQAVFFCFFFMINIQGEKKEQLMKEQMFIAVKNITDNRS